VRQHDPLRTSCRRWIHRRLGSTAP
jgi:hypothetical protein